jgi:hypothetical protein
MRTSARLFLLSSVSTKSGFFGPGQVEGQGSSNTRWFVEAGFSLVA